MPDDLVADWQELTPAEQDFLHAVLSGRRAELAGQTIRASVVRDLAIGANPDQRVPPVGIGIHNATIEGQLDFEGCAVDKPLVFLRCRFVPAGTEDTALHLRDASLKRIALYECTVTGAIKADRAHFETRLLPDQQHGEGHGAPARRLHRRGARHGRHLNREPRQHGDPRRRPAARRPVDPALRQDRGRGALCGSAHQRRHAVGGLPDQEHRRRRQRRRGRRRRGVGAAPRRHRRLACACAA